MPYCSNCGHKVEDEANFCPKCGKTLKPATPPAEKPKPAPIHKKPSVKPDSTFTLLEPGSVFNKHYRIEKVLNKDTEGISYVAMDTEVNRLCSLKLFYQTYFDNVDKLFGSILRMSKIKAIRHPNIVQVYEVDQSYRPAYISSEYVAGRTLSDIKENSPALLTEQFIRQISLSLAKAAEVIHKAGLSIQKLSLHDIVLTDSQDIKILSSGISYELCDERDDVFSIGVVLAKLAANTPFYEGVYSHIRLAERKYEYINGITKSFNHIIAECLHRNILQRYTTLEALIRAIESLPSVDTGDIYISSSSDLTLPEPKNKMEPPKRRIDIWFWVLCLVVFIFIVLMLTSNLPLVIFGKNHATFRFSGFLSTPPDTTAPASVASDNYRGSRSTVGNTKFRDFATRLDDNADNNDTPAIDPRVNVPAGQSLLNPSGNSNVNLTRNSLPVKRSNPISADFVYIPGNTYAFGNLRKDARDNVSINGFYISKSEVTQGDWNKFMKPAAVSSKGDVLPVDNVNWYDAVLYCNSLSDAEGLTQCYRISGFGSSMVVTCNFRANGYRLPTEAEWEYAARDSRTTIYSGSDKADDVAWDKSNAGGRLHPIKTKAANAFGLFDMSGNVAEWCWDWFDLNYTKVMPFINPTGPDTGNAKVIRGGSIDQPEGSGLELLRRAKGDPNSGYRYVGFRLVRNK